MQVGLIAHPFFVDHQALFETVEPVRGGCGMWCVAREQMGKTEPTRRGRLESAIAPAAVEIEPVDMRFVDDW